MSTTHGGRIIDNSGVNGWIVEKNTASESLAATQAASMEICGG